MSTQETDSDDDASQALKRKLLENPTCRWSTWEALRAGVEPRSDLPTTVMERAWSSPIWYRSGRP